MSYPTIAPANYENTYPAGFHSVGSEALPWTLGQKVEQAHNKLLEQRLFLQQLLAHNTSEVRLAQKKKTPELKSKNSIWDVIKLTDRFKKSEYDSLQSREELLRFDAVHHAKEMALIEPVTRFSYWHTPKTNETLGDGYSEDISLMLNAFTQDLAQKGMDAARASIEALTFENAKEALSQIALTKLSNSKTELSIDQINQTSLDQSINLSNQAVLITSFPDDEASGYHGVDSKYNWMNPETHHSFFYLLRVGKIKTNADGTLSEFEIHTTQYRMWPNAHRAIQLHELFGAPLTDQSLSPQDRLDQLKNENHSLPNLLFANLIHLDESALQKIAMKLGFNYTELLEKDSQIGPTDQKEDSFEKIFKQLLYSNSQEDVINYTHIPSVELDEFWHMQELYFSDFYLEVAQPVFAEITQLQSRLSELSGKEKLELLKYIQQKIDYLDKAFFYYSKILLGWVQINNTNPKYAEAFKEKSKLKQLMSFQQKLLLRLLGQKQTTELPDVDKLKVALEIDHKIATKQFVSAAEKKQLLSIWGFFSAVGSFSSLLQCGTIAPFTMPITIMNNGFGAESIPTFSASLSQIPIPEKQKLLELLTQEEYVELDLTSQGAKKVYTVPKSYLSGKGCIVGQDGSVLGPCIDPETNQRIPLDDPRDTMAFPLTLAEFHQYITELQKNVEQQTLTELDQLFQDEEFSDEDKRKAQVAIKKIRQRLIKNSVGLQELFTGDVVNRNAATNEWLKELLMKLSFSLNPVETLVQEVEQKLKTEKQTVEQSLEFI